jgi:hypothetical protein
MKVLPSPTLARRVMRTDDGLGRGMDAAFTLLAFFGIGFGLDRWWGTTPVMMIVTTVLASIGIFLSWKARYTAAMEELEAQRRAPVAATTREAPR